MDKLMNRCRAFAEGVVVMACPVLLALALNKVDLKSEEHGPAFPIVMLVTAGATLVSGICPVLACCFSKRFTTVVVTPHRVTRSMAPFSSACLVVLACLIVLLIISRTRVITIGTMFGVCILIRTVCYCYARNDDPIPIGHARNDDPIPIGHARNDDPIPIGHARNDDPIGHARNDDVIAQQEAQEEFHSKLDNSLEFLSGVTGILFLGLEGLALGDQVSSSKGLRAPMGISFFACALGVFLMFLEMIPPLIVTTNNIALCTVILDGLMAIGTVAVLVVIMLQLMGPQALLLFTPAFLIFLDLAFQIAVNDKAMNRTRDEESGDNNNASKSGNAADSAATPGGGGRNDDDNHVKPASLELTKVTFTGFLAVSVAAISSGSPNQWTDWFLLFAAAAIVSGIAWRLLTHAKSQPWFVESANVASFCAHLCVAVASILFAVMAGKALP